MMQTLIRELAQERKQHAHARAAWEAFEEHIDEEASQEELPQAGLGAG